MTEKFDMLGGDERILAANPYAEDRINQLVIPKDWRTRDSGKHLLETIEHATANYVKKQGNDCALDTKALAERSAKKTEELMDFIAANDYTITDLLPALCAAFYLPTLEASSEVIAGTIDLMKWLAKNESKEDSHLEESCIEKVARITAAETNFQMIAEWLNYCSQDVTRNFQMFSEMMDKLRGTE